MKRPETIPSLLAELKVAWPLYEAALKVADRADHASIMTTASDQRDKTRAKAALIAERNMRGLEKRAFGLRKAIIAAPARNLAELLAKMQMVQEGDHEEDRALVDHAVADLERLVGKAVTA